MIWHIQKSIGNRHGMTGFRIRRAFCGADNTGNGGGVSSLSEIPQGWRICKKCLKIKEARTNDLNRRTRSDL